MIILGDVYKLDVRTLSINFETFIYIVKEITHINTLLGLSASISQKFRDFLKYHAKFRKEA